MGHDEFDWDAHEEQPLFTSEDELKKKVTKLERELKKHDEANQKTLRAQAKLGERALLNTVSFYESELQTLREQIRQLFEKNLELHETSKIFVKGLEHLKKDGITVTLTHHWTRRGTKGMKERITELVLDGKKIVALMPLSINPQGDTIEGIIVTEHTDRAKKPI